MKMRTKLVIVILLLIGLLTAGCDYCYMAANKRDYDRAITECTEQVNRQHIFRGILAKSYLNRGIAYAGKGFPDQAIADYNKAIENDPDFVFAYNNRGAAYLQKSLNEQAIADFTKAITLKPDFVLAYYNRAFAFKKAGRYSDAINDLDYIISLKQNNEIAYSIRASVYEVKGEFEQALVDHDKAIALNPNNTVVYDSRGTTYMRHGQYRQADSDFKKSIELNPKNSLPYYNMACLYSLKKDSDNACTWLNKSISIGFSNWTLIRTDADLNNIKESPCYRTILAEHPDKPAGSPVPEAQAHAAPEALLFSKGMSGFTFLFGRGKAFDNTYAIYGFRVGHFVRDGLEAGISFVDWTNASPRIVQAGPDVRYVWYEIPYVKPYGGLLYRHSFIQGYDDVDEVGVRAGGIVLLSSRSYLGAGIVYKSAIHCSGNCTSLDPEIMAAILF